jgi:hypothetical protein
LDHKCASKGVFLMELEEDDDPATVANDLGGLTECYHRPVWYKYDATSDSCQGETVACSSGFGLNSFIHEVVVHELGLDVVQRSGLTVKVANRERLQSYGICKNTVVEIQGETFTMDCYTLPLEGFDVMLGVHWLKSLGPIAWDFTTLSMAFLRQGRSIRFIGCGGGSAGIYTISHEDDLLQALLQTYSDIFEQPKGLPPPPRHDHRIHLLRGTAPIAVKPYRYPQLLKDEVKRQCADMLEQGTIRPSTSPFSSPILLVKKANSSWRFCVDYRGLNDKTVKDKFLILVVEELLDELRGARFFTKIDLRSGYHQVHMHPDDIEKTAFRMHHGHFEFTVMTFGLTNAPATFQSLMNDVLHAFIHMFILVFFDDILIYSSTWAKHLQHVKIVFDQIRRHKLFVKQSKCIFGSTTVSYLGHIISSDGVAMDPDKVTAVDSWPTLKTLWALRGFLGLTGYYRKFIARYGDIARPLTALLK